MDFINDCSNISEYTNPKNFSLSFLTSICDDLQNFSTIPEDIAFYSIKYVLIIDLILLTTIILISIFGPKNDDYKWFILNWSGVNFIYVFYEICQMILPNINFGEDVSILMYYWRVICKHSILLIALTR